ncbi:MAG: hypothetical protein AAB774_03110, partial [Patescibacteria group bacterium]
MKKVWWIIIVIVLLIAGGAGYLAQRKFRAREAVAIPSADSSQSEKDSAAIKAGKQLTNNNCKGDGPGVLTRLPMDEPDYSMILPYGLMTGGHVTP